MIINQSLALVTQMNLFCIDLLQASAFLLIFFCPEDSCEVVAVVGSCDFYWNLTWLGCPQRDATMPNTHLSKYSLLHILSFLAPAALAFIV